MKVIITGATGAIGGIILQHCLQHPSITFVVALTRRPLASTTNAHESSKLRNILIPDFSAPETVDGVVWERLVDADAMIWAQGTYTLDDKVNLEFPKKWQEEFGRRRNAFLALSSSKTLPSTSTLKKPFRFILLGGAFVEPDQTATLFFLPAQRKQKGRLQVFTLSFASSSPQKETGWQAVVIRPGGILFGGDTWKNSAMEKCVGAGLVIQGQELGAAVADLVVKGGEEVIGNKALVERGRRALRVSA